MASKSISLLELYIRNRWGLDERVAKEIADFIDVIAKMVCVMTLEKINVLTHNQAVKVMKEVID